MALTRIEYGSLASSETMNNNFEYLDNKIAEASERITSTSASIYSNIASVNTQLSNQINAAESELQTYVDTQTASAVGALSSNGLYITTYINGTSWYREYFSDSAKTTRVWLEQGGVSGNGATISLLKRYSNTNYNILFSVRNGESWGGAEYMGWKCENITTSGFYIQSRGWDRTAPNLSWYTCGK